MNETEVACGGFVVSCSEAPGAFELVEAAFHTISQGVCDGIDEDRFVAVGLAGNDGRAAALFDDLADVIAVITTIRDEHFGFGKIIIDQCVEAFEVRDLATAYLRPDRQSVSVGNEVDLGRKATF